MHSYQKQQKALPSSSKTQKVIKKKKIFQKVMLQHRISKRDRGE